MTSNNFKHIPFQYLGSCSFTVTGSNQDGLMSYADAFLMQYYAMAELNVSSQHHQQNMEIIRKQGGQAEISSPKMPLADEAAVYAVLPPEVEATLRAAQNQLHEALDVTYPLLEGEVIQQSTLSALTEEYNGNPAGSIVYIRESNFIRLDCILPLVQVNIANGEIAVTDLGGKETENSPELSLPTFVAMGTAPPASIIHSVGSNLAFALPEPWGPFAAAGIAGIFGLLFGSGPSHTLEEIQKMIEAGVKEVESFLVAQEFKSVRSDIHSFFDWCATQVNQKPLAQL